VLPVSTLREFNFKVVELRSEHVCAVALAGFYQGSHYAVVSRVKDLEVDSLTSRIWELRALETELATVSLDSIDWLVIFVLNVKVVVAAVIWIDYLAKVLVLSLLNPVDLHLLSVQAVAGALAWSLNMEDMLSFVLSSWSILLTDDRHIQGSAIWREA
jgi:hypothetical protein